MQAWSAGRAFGCALVLMLCMVALGVVGSCFYAPPAWNRTVEHTRSNAEERRYAIVMLSSLEMEPRGLAAFPDGGIPITLGQVSDVWVCDPQRNMVKKVATIDRPPWIGGASTVWMINWQSHGERSSLYVRIRTEGSTSDTPATAKHVRIDFDRNTLEHPTVVDLGPFPIDRDRHDFVNPPPEYGIMSIRGRGDTLFIWTDRSPERRARFRIDKASGNILALAPVPKRLAARADSTLDRSVRGEVCPDHIRGVPSPTESRLAFGTPPVLVATITRVDASCEQRPHPVVGDENDGDMEFFITLSGWVDCRAIDGKQFKVFSGLLGEEVVFEALSASSEVLGSTSMGYLPYPGGTTLNLDMRMNPEQLSRVTRVVARWDRIRNTR